MTLETITLQLKNLHANLEIMLMFVEYPSNMFILSYMILIKELRHPLVEVDIIRILYFNCQCMFQYILRALLNLDIGDNYTGQ